MTLGRVVRRWLAVLKVGGIGLSFVLVVTSMWRNAPVIDISMTIII